MFERFTDRARKALSLANQEAQRFNHEFVGPEHLLLGLVKEGGGVGANVLKNLDVDLRKVRLEVEKLVASGPDMVTMGKLPHTPQAKQVLEHAIEEAKALNHNYVGTEHILLGLLREPSHIAGTVLAALGVSSEKVRAAVMEILSEGAAEPVRSDTDALAAMVRQEVRHQMGLLMLEFAGKMFATVNDSPTWKLNLRTDSKGEVTWDATI